MSASSLVADAKETFQKYDANQSGSIDKQELSRILDDMGMKSVVDDEWFQNLCARHDQNDTHEFEFEEFVQIYNELAAKLGGGEKGGAGPDLLIYNLEM